MRRVALLLALIGLSHSALAATSAPGFNLRWDQCYADGGTWNKNFACDTNAGSDRLVVSFELANTLTQMSGVEISLDIGSSGASLPAWWQFKSTGTCRRTSLIASIDMPAGSVNCVDWGGGQTAGGIGTYNIGFLGANTARLLVVAAVPQSSLATIVPGQEYFAFGLTIDHAKTVGSGACAGCNVPVCIFVSSMTLTTPVAANDVMLGQGANFLGSSYATWQNGYPTNVSRFCNGGPGVPRAPNCVPANTTFQCVLATPTNSRRSTWGAVKALYR
ncbi:MAG: hypothetical protein K8R56_09435 [Candidatus Eisenbacteria bacterium]|nr:hypothetical protein [Candidatus Eisenbacteria bacterium]